MKGEEVSEGENMEKNERENMEKTENGGLGTEKTEINGTLELDMKADSNDEPEINYRGWKAMPFIIGETVACLFVCLFHTSFGFILSDKFP